MEKKKQGIVITSVLLVCLILVVIGVSFAFFTYSRQGSKENTITTGSLTFVYDEQKAEGNGITLSNAFPMSDEDGKQLSGSNNVFDFQVLASTKGESIAYEVIGQKDDSSTLPENVTKIYLTTLSGSEESEVVTTVKDGVVTTYDELSDTQIKEQTGKTLYQEVIPLNQTGYQKNFRLRMWLSEEANTTTNGSWDYNNKTFTIRINVVANGEGTIENKPNAPELMDGMIPVTYNGTNWVKADTSSEWYNYDNQEWANAVTVTEENRATYMSAPSGTVIPMADINTMWVWIPRYSYTIGNTYGVQGYGGSSPSQSTPGAIDIKFVNKGTKETGTAQYTGSEASNWRTPDGFTFGEEELSGFWYAKFETGGTLTNTCVNELCNISNVLIKPDVFILEQQTISSFFYMARSMQMNGNNPYGFTNTTGDAHMSKNSEWGAVAYLSQSKYGKYGNPNYTGTNKEIYINDSFLYTGRSSGLTFSNGGNSNGTYLYHDSKNLSDGSGAVGLGASTTGNITGIYDMNGGSPEFVMGNYNNVLGASGFSSLPETKYYDLYTTADVTTACDGGICYGHALSETKNWYGDRVTVASSNASWYFRGGSRDNAAGEGGIFYSSPYNGSHGSIATRLTFVP